MGNAQWAIHIGTTYRYYIFGFACHSGVHVKLGLNEANWGMAGMVTW